LGLIEQWGSGIQRMTAACEEAGLDSPQFEEIGTHFRVTFWAFPRSERKMDDLDQRILDVLEETPGLTTEQVATSIGRSSRATRARLASLVGRGLVAEMGTSPNDPKRNYFSTRRA